MDKKKLSINDSTIAYVAGFILGQLSVITLMCVALIFAIIFKIDITETTLFFNTAVGYLLCTIAMDLALVLVFFHFNKKTDNQIAAKPSVKKIFLYLLIAISTFFALCPIITCIDSFLVKINFQLNTIPYSLTTGNYFISIISLAILPAICEELLFRGIIFKGLKPYGKIFSISVSAILFSLFHMSLDQTVYPLLIGLLLGVIMYYENNILYTILIHLTNNFLSLTLAYFNISLIFTHWSYILIAIILLISFLTIVLYFVIKNNRNSASNKPTSKETLFLIVIILALLVIWIATTFSKFSWKTKHFLN